MKRKLVPYLIISIVVIMASYQAVGLLKYPRPEVLSATSTVSTEDRLTALERRVSSLERYTGMVKVPASGVAKINYVSLSGGTAGGSDWVKMAGTDFTLDQSLYGNVTEVTWQGWIDSGYGSARLYDNTNHRAVDGSEISVTSGSRASFYSKPLSIWRGQNQYWIEVRSIAGDVTVSEPKLKIITR